MMAWTVGCGGGGGEPASVSGTVNYGGEPIQEGSIQFRPVEGTPGAGGAAKITDGSYSVSGTDTLKSGKHLVMITATRGTGKMVQAEGPVGEEGEGDGAPAAGGGGGEMVEETEQFIPIIYNTSSKLEADLKAGDNPNTNFDLEAQDEEGDS